MTDEEKSQRAAQLHAEIAAVNAALTRVEADQREALADITVRGTWVMRTVLDSKRRPIEKPGLNPSVSVITATEKIKRTLTRKLASLAASLAALEKPKNRWAEIKEQVSQ